MLWVALGLNSPLKACILSEDIKSRQGGKEQGLFIILIIGSQDNGQASFLLKFQPSGLFLGKGGEETYGTEHKK